MPWTVVGPEQSSWDGAIARRDFHSQRIEASSVGAAEPGTDELTQKSETKKCPLP